MNMEAGGGAVDQMRVPLANGTTGEKVYRLQSVRQLTAVLRSEDGCLPQSAVAADAMDAVTTFAAN